MRGLRVAVPAFAAVPLAGCEVSEVLTAGLVVAVLAVLCVLVIVSKVEAQIRG